MEIQLWTGFADRTEYKIAEIGLARLVARVNHMFAHDYA